MRISERRRRGARSWIGFACLCLLAAGEAAPVESGSWTPAAADYVWSFPRDHRSHPGYRIEWWYFTGHLVAPADAADATAATEEAPTAPPRRFGYQLTFFRVGVLPEVPPLDSDWASANLFMGHAAITDIDAGEHVFAEVLHREREGLASFGAEAGEPIAWARADAGTDGEWSLVAQGDGFAFGAADARLALALELRVSPAKPLVFQGPDGFSRKSDAPGAASHYYSYTRMRTEGRLSLAGRTYTVTGESWMDHEFSSSQLSARQVGWDWFSLQLRDGRELMLYRLRRADGTTDYAKGTLVSVTGELRYLDRREFAVRATGSWRSAKTQIDYPSGWIVELQDESTRLVIRPDVVDQENVSRLPYGPSYWEGAVTVFDGDDRELGRGYVELTGYGENNRPPV